MHDDVATLLEAHLHDRAQGAQMPDDLLRKADRHNRRRRAITATVAGCGAAAVAATLVSTAGGGTAKPNEAAASRAQVGPRLETVAYVRQRIAAAPTASDAIVRTTSTGYGQTNDNWSDTRTGYVTDYTASRGSVWSVSHYPVGRAGNDTELDYPSRTYYVKKVSSDTPLPTHTTGKLGEPLLASAEGIKAAIARSDVRIVGHGYVGGRPVTHLTFHFRAQGQEIDGDAWFDRQTYVPLKATTSYGPIHETVAYLQRTRATVAKAALHIPDGFRQVAPPK